MAGVVVSLRNRAIGFGERAVTTGATGKFTFPNLPPAQDYLLRAVFPGFATLEIRIEIRISRVGILEKQPGLPDGFFGRDTNVRMLLTKRRL